LIWGGRHLFHPLDEVAKLNPSSSVVETERPNIKVANAVSKTTLLDIQVADKVKRNTSKIQSQDISKVTASSQVATPDFNKTTMQRILSNQSISDTKRNAYDTLMSIWGIPKARQSHGLVCQKIEMSGLRCMHKQGNWRSLLDFNRPAVMHLQTKQGKSFDVALIKVKGELVKIVLNTHTFWVSRPDLDAYWYGDYSLFWKLPDYLSRLIKPGMITDKNKWLKQTILRVSAHIPTLDQTFILSHSLKDSVRLFQRSQGLVDDGIVGAVTLIHLNSYIYSHLPLLQGHRE
jgi:general secretion pathway protein A